MATSKKSAKAIIDNDILVHGARTHNLKNVTVSFPRNKLIVVTGVSGSGKSSLINSKLFDKSDTPKLKLRPCLRSRPTSQRTVSRESYKV